MVLTEGDLSAWEALRTACRRRMDAEDLSQKDVLAQTQGINQGNFSWWLVGKKHSPTINRVIAAWLGDEYRPSDALVRTDDPGDNDESIEEIALPPSPREEDPPSPREEDTQSVASTLSGILVDFARLSVRDCEPPASRKDRVGFVYVMETPLRGGGVAYKVGYARGSAEDRETSLRTGNPDLQLTMCQRTLDCVRAESYAHGLLDKWRYRRAGSGREFFTCTQEQACMAVIQACTEVDRVRIE